MLPKAGFNLRRLNETKPARAGGSSGAASLRLRRIMGSKETLHQRNGAVMQSGWLELSVFARRGKDLAKDSPAQLSQGMIPQTA
jgi:hypothetical protein